MVERTADLDRVFFGLADSTRRGMLALLKTSPEMGVGDIAAHYRMSFAGVAKHVKVLETARLVAKRRDGKRQMVRLIPETAARARNYLDQYANIVNARFDRLETLLKKETS